MTAAPVANPPCPQCSSPYTVDMEGGLRFCPECRNEWDPNIPQSPADVLGPPPEVADELRDAEAAKLQDTALAEAFLEGLTGQRVAMKNGWEGTVVGFGDDGDVLIRDEDDSDVWCVVEDIDHVIEATAPASLEDIDMDQETAALVGDTVLTMACLAVEAGLAAVVGTGEDAHLIEPAAGWIPDDANAIPIMEQAAAVAVAMICISFDLDRAMLAAAVDKIRPATREASNKKDEG